MLRGIVAVAFVAAVSWAAAAEATGPRPSPYIVTDRGLEVFRERRVTVQANPNCYDHTGKYVCGGRPPGATGAPHCYDHTGKFVCGGVNPDRHDHNRHHRPFVVPQPVYVAPRGHCYAPGYWTAQWVPQHSLYTVWVDGYRAGDGTWITGHFEQRTYVSGYTQQNVWTPERWGC